MGQLLCIGTGIFGQKTTKQPMKADACHNTDNRMWFPSMMQCIHSPFFALFSLAFFFPFCFFPLEQLLRDSLTPESRQSRGALGLLLLWDPACCEKQWCLKDLPWLPVLQKKAAEKLLFATIVPMYPLTFSHREHNFDIYSSRSFY